MEIKVIDPFTNIPLKTFEVSSPNGEAVYLSNLKELNIGDGGNNVFRADKTGIWLGAKTFAAAPFSVSMAGAVTASSLTITGGTIKYGKTSFTDSVHAGYYFGNEGIYLGSAADATLFKFTMLSGLIDHIGTVSGRSTATIASAINASGEATAIIDNLVTTLKIADGQVTAAKTSIAAINATSGEINANKVGTTQIDANAVTEAKILASAVTEAKIAASAVTEGKISALAVTAGKIASGAITADKISAGAVTASKLTSYNFIMSAGTFSNNTPGAGQISWTGAKVVYNGTEYTIADGNCLATAKHIYWQLSSPTSFSSSISLPALGNDDFLVAFNNSGSAVLVWNSTIINGNRITSGSITATQISAHSITANEIAASTITANEIAASTITAAKMNVSQLSAISADMGSITAGTITGALLQTSSSSYAGAKMSSTLGGIVLYGESMEIRDTSNTLYGTIGGYSGYFNIYTSADRNMRLSAGAGYIYTSSDIRPASDGIYSLGGSGAVWNTIYGGNIVSNNYYEAGGSQRLYYSSSKWQSSSDFKVNGSISLTGNMEFLNYASLTIKDSGGTSRTLTCQYDSTLGKYILST